MLSEEEKKAVEIVKEIKNIKFKVTSSFYSSGTISLTIEEKEAIDTVLNLVTRFQKEIEHQKEKRENQKTELAILNEKQKDMNKLINTVKSYKGQFKRQEKQIRELQKENEELKLDNLEKARILEVFDDRKYRKKYLEERRKEEPNLLYPDGDEIYKRYYEQKKQIDLMAEKIHFLGSEYDDFCIDTIWNEDCDKDCKDCIKQYFEKLVKEKGK